MHRSKVRITIWDPRQHELMEGEKLPCPEPVTQKCQIRGGERDDQIGVSNKQKER
jgi:hypothetical protein